MMRTTDNLIKHHCQISSQSLIRFSKDFFVPQNVSSSHKASENRRKRPVHCLEFARSRIRGPERARVNREINSSYARWII